MLRLNRCCRPHILRPLYLAVVLGLTLVQPASAGSYSATQVTSIYSATLSGVPWSSSDLAGINSAGSVAGRTTMIVNSVVQHRAISYVDNMLTQLGTLTGDGASGAADINTAGTIVGYSDSKAGYPHAMKVVNGTMTDLGSIARGGSGAWAINDSGLIVGYSIVQGGKSHAMKYDTRMRDLGSLPGRDNSNATAVNNAGQIVGYAYTPNCNGCAPEHAFLYSGSTMTDLGTLGGTRSYALGINDTGVVVGTSTTSAGKYHAFTYDNGVMRDITPDANVANALAINANGVIVGEMDGYAFLYQDGQVIDLNTTLEPGSGVNLKKAMDINANGDIVAWGTLGGENALLRLSLSLIGRFAPELRYDTIETYRADSAAEATDNFVTGSHTNLLKGYDERTIAAADPSWPYGDLSLSFLQPVGGTYPDGSAPSSNDYIDLANGTYVSDFNRLHQLPQYRNVVYARTFPVPGTSDTIIQFWMYYYYNPKVFVWMGNHEGDWEVVQYRVNAAGALVTATYSQHGAGERCAASEVPLSSAGRPITYVAEGSHANYYWPGSHSLPYGQNDNTDGAGERIVPTTLVDVTAPPNWLRWSGSWGASKGIGGEGASPVSPTIQGPWMNPVSFETNADSCSPRPAGVTVPNRVEPLATRGSNENVTLVKPLRSSTAASRTSGDIERPSIPPMTVRVRDGRVTVRYCFKSISDNVDLRPWQIITSVDSPTDTYTPYTFRRPVTLPCGNANQPMGPASGERSLRVIIVSRTGVRSKARVFSLGSR